MSEIDIFNLIIGAIICLNSCKIMVFLFCEVFIQWSFNPQVIMQIKFCYLNHEIIVFCYENINKQDHMYALSRKREGYHNIISQKIPQPFPEDWLFISGNLKDKMNLVMKTW